MNKLIIGAAILLGVSGISGCQDDAQIAKHNMAKAADNFEVNRRIVFYNAWADKNVLSVEGLCSIEYRSERVYYICKIGRDKFINNFIGNSDIVVPIVEQLDPLPVNVYHYRRTFKPQSVIPDIDLRYSGGSVVKALTPDNKD